MGINYVIVPIGSKIKINRFDGFVNAATISDCGIVYRISYWNDDYKEVFVYEHEFEYLEDKYSMVTEK